MGENEGDLQVQVGMLPSRIETHIPAGGWNSHARVPVSPRDREMRATTGATGDDATTRRRDDERDERGENAGSVDWRCSRRVDHLHAPAPVTLHYFAVTSSRCQVCPAQVLSLEAGSVPAAKPPTRMVFFRKQGLPFRGPRPSGPGSGAGAGAALDFHLARFSSASAASVATM
ncbi:hypothetical protein CC85DRAFT_199640 [Cutaneotrichosporon oleaginosum]|uniref:Uncharacterized protein n=1 Tax=Cutaneotrichosporon oleaginosum TaxID=879819 RepID=A0A0J0XDV6_9TREE|nr:uncharacterized protein CC85DRAFT_199640 [Cutaneotrichosporon oleaginosum]KLT39285.1 hypothetical protein CC85DRAFT_199640 [Cutaneotrichosporon oleaginosum]TXT05883.1 hypothetical protein COLE_07203 [Cutaneotrichosporon oleaginosum]